MKYIDPLLAIPSRNLPPLPAMAYRSAAMADRRGLVEPGRGHAVAVVALVVDCLQCLSRAGRIAASDVRGTAASDRGTQLQAKPVQRKGDGVDSLRCRLAWCINTHTL